MKIAVLVSGRGSNLQALIKNLHGMHPLLENCIRVTVGTPAENARLLSALAVLLDAPSNGAAATIRVV